MLNTNETGKEQSNLFVVGEQDFEKEVLTSSLPVIVDFWATWCPPCRALAPVYQRLSAEYAGRLRFAKLDVDEHQQVVVRYNIWANPTLLIFKDGKECARFVGPHPSRLKNMIDRALAEA